MENSEIQHFLVKVPQDLHIHSVFSKRDTSVAETQTIPFLARFRHAEIQGISDHLECFDTEEEFDSYTREARFYDMVLGIEVNGRDWVREALRRDVDYYIYHCRDTSEDYRGAEKLLDAGKPVIIAHPCALDTDLSRVPEECYIELNNRYIWRKDWQAFYRPYVNTKQFVIGSDAHQPNWLNHTIARRIAHYFDITECILFPETADRFTSAVY